ncbi:MAG: glycosyltransferase family 4 protein [Candidatus Rifleibacteriota bacterium]
MIKLGYLTFGCDSGRSGIGRYAIELLRELANLNNELEIETVGFADEKKIFVNETSLKWLSVDDYYRSPLKNIIWHQLNLASMAVKRGWQAVFLPAGNRRLPFYSPVPSIGVVHDFSALHVPNKYDQNRMFYIMKVLPMLMRRLTRVITISESSLDDIVNFARVPAKKVSIIHHGVDHKRFFPVEPSAAFAEISHKFPFKMPFILYISRIEHPGKNHVKLIKAFESLKSELQIPHCLVLAGSDWDRAEEVHALAERSQYSSDIFFTGFVSGGEMANLLKSCDLFVFPSLFEGFGMPILEAMACRVPVACSNISSMPEVAGNAAELFDPGDHLSIKDAMARILTDENYRKKLMEDGYRRVMNFTWKNTAEKTLAVIKDAVRQGG